MEDHLNYIKSTDFATMKTIVNVTISIFLFANSNASIATSFSFPSSEWIFNNSEIIGIYSDVKINKIDKEKDLIKLIANNLELPLKGRVKGKVKFCSHFVDDFVHDNTISIDVYRVYLLFLRRTPTRLSRKKEFKNCDYMVLSPTQNAYPILDYSSDPYSGVILIFRLSGLSGLYAKEEFYISINKIYTMIELEDVLKTIKSQLQITVP